MCVWGIWMDLTGARESERVSVVGNVTFRMQTRGLRCPRCWEAMTKPEGIVCTFQAQRGRRDSSGHRAPRMPAGQLLQPSTKLALSDLAHACGARTLQTHRQAGRHTPRAAPGGVFKPLSPRSQAVLSLGFGLVNFSKLYIREVENFCSTGEQRYLPTHASWNLPGWKAGNYRL